jgi:hypothetical protein
MNFWRRWWNRFLAWTGASEPGVRKELLEDWIEVNEARLEEVRDWLDSDRGDESKLANDRWYKHVPKSDRKIPSLPVWADVQINSYEAPTQHSPKATKMGWMFSFHVNDTDGSVWLLSVDPAGDRSAWDWQDITPRAII